MVLYSRALTLKFDGLAAFRFREGRSQHLFPQYNLPETRTIALESKTGSALFNLPILFQTRAGRKRTALINIGTIWKEIRGVKPPGKHVRPGGRRIQTQARYDRDHIQRCLDESTSWREQTRPEPS